MSYKNEKPNFTQLQRTVLRIWGGYILHCDGNFCMANFRLGL